MIKPFVTKRLAVNLAKEVFHLKVSESSSLMVKELNSHEARCFYIRGLLPLDEREREFTLKICKFEDFHNEKGIVDELNDIMIHVNKRGIPCSVPQRTATGKFYEMRKINTHDDTPTASTSLARSWTSPEEAPLKNTAHNCVVRLLSYIPGQIMRDIPCGMDMFYQVGRFAAKVDKVLKNFECPMLQTRSPRWDLNNLPLAKNVSSIIQAPGQKKHSHNIENLFHTEVQPRLDSLPRQCIHADINETNIIFKNFPRSTRYDTAGVIDFDLASYNCRVFEVAASAAYMMTMHPEEPLEAGAHTVAGYQLTNPLSTDESDLIFYLIQTRLYLSICYGTLACKNFPRNSDYLLYTVQRAWKVLDKLTQANKDEFDERWQELCTMTWQLSSYRR